MFELHVMKVYHVYLYFFFRHDVIPIVMGAAPEDYKRAAPPHSYIHVEDFESPKELAEYLIKLDQNDDLYNEYFRWKGTGTNINTFFWCRICAMLHKSRESHSYRDLERWWRGPEVCIGMDKWRDHPRKSKYIVQDFLWFSLFLCSRKGRYSGMNIYISRPYMFVVVDGTLIK